MKNRHLNTLLLLFCIACVAKGQFTILVGIYPKPVTSQYFSAIDFPIKELQHLNGYYHYHAGNFPTHIDAEIALMKVKKTAFVEAKIIDLEAEELLNSLPCPYEIEQFPNALNTFYMQVEGKSPTLPLHSRMKLKEIADILKSNPMLVVTITGHTDCEGTAEENMLLSGKFARNARDFLIDTHRIPASRIFTMEAGESRPLLPNSDQYNRAISLNRYKNNRITVTVHM